MVEDKPILILCANSDVLWGGYNQPIEMNWNERLKAMLKHHKLSLKDVAEITGNSYGSIRTVVTSQDFPRWAKLAIVLFELEKDNIR